MYRAALQHTGSLLEKSDKADRSLMLLSGFLGGLISIFTPMTEFPATLSCGFVRPPGVAEGTVLVTKGAPVALTRGGYT